MRFCSKCGDFHADRLLAFCPADGTPLVDVDPSGDSWEQATRVIEQKRKGLRTQQRRLKWRRVMLRAMLMATMVVTVAAVNRSISVTVDKPGELCIATFNDLNGNGKQDAGEPGLSGFAFQVSGTAAATTLTTDLKGGVCSPLAVGTYTVVEQPLSGLIATTPTTQTVTVTAGQAAKLFFGSRQETELCIRKFDDLNGNGVRDAGEAGLSGFGFLVNGTGAATTLTTGPNGVVCAVMPVGTYTVVEHPQAGWIATTPTTQTVTVTAGQAADVLFGSRQERGELGIQDFNDLNGNGVREPKEPGLSGFLFQVGGTDPATTLTTGPNGVSSVVLPVGTYTVSETPKPGWTTTTPPTQTVTVTAGQTANLFFGNRQARGQLGIQDFNDLNGNGVREPNEPGLSGFVFQVRGPDTVTTLTTGPNGVSSAVLLVGAYTVVEQPQGGWTATTPTTQTVTVAAGQSANMLFGSRKERGKLCILTFDDQNGNRAKEADEPGLSGFVFEVRGTDPATTLKPDLKESVCSELPIGKYTVVETPKPGWIATTPTTQTVTITAGQSSNVLFGSRQERAKLCITTFDDQNGNRAKEASEPGLSGFVFQVSGTGRATKLTTDRKGGTCSDLPVGTYTVVEQPQDGWIATTPTTQTVTVTAGRTANVSFGSRKERGKKESGKLCIRTFDDQNGNRAQDAGEPKLSGFVFEVRGTGAATTFKTDPKGGGCSELPIGTYTVVEQPQDDWIATTPTTQTVTVTAGQSATVLFGCRKGRGKEESGKLCIRTFDDQNGNGAKEADEPDLSGVVFQVSGTAVATTLKTDLKGGICSELPVGKYTVVETPKPGWTATTKTPQTITVIANQSVNLFFGNTKRADSNTACSDADRSREREIILHRFDNAWSRIIESDRPRIIEMTGAKDVRLSRIKYETVFSRSCATARVTARYAWQVNKSEKLIKGDRGFECTKTGGVWDCRTI